MLDGLPSPSQMTGSGTTALGRWYRSNAINGSKAVCLAGQDPITMPSGTDISAAVRLPLAAAGAHARDVGACESVGVEAARTDRVLL